jgi:hypothetical protein
MVLVYVSAINRKKAKYLILLLAFMLLGSGLVYTFRDTLLLNRYSQAFDLYDNQDRILTRNYSINNRIKLYIIGASLLEDHERYGINGTGLSYSVIRKKYNSRFSDEFPFETSTFNTHNQYINNFIDWGLAGLLLMCYLLFQPIRISFRSGKCVDEPPEVLAGLDPAPILQSRLALIEEKLLGTHFAWRRHIGAVAAAAGHDRREPKQSQRKDDTAGPSSPGPRRTTVEPESVHSHHCV